MSNMSAQAAKFNNERANDTEMSIELPKRIVDAVECLGLVLSIFRELQSNPSKDPNAETVRRNAITKCQQSSRVSNVVTFGDTNAKHTLSRF